MPLTAYIVVMSPPPPWTVLFHWEFVAEFKALSDNVKLALGGHIEALREYGPTYGATTRRHVGTLTSLSYSNLKELRFNCEGVWRFVFAFDPQRSAILLVGGDKEGEKEKLFYERLIGVAERRYASHLRSLAEKKEKPK